MTSLSGRTPIKNAVSSRNLPCRQRDASKRRAISTTGTRSLLAVPGIGKKARDRLEKASVDSVTALLDLYIEEHGREKEELIKYLKALGIGSRWLNTIADWVHDETKPIAAKQITLCVEGNIGVGKTTWLETVKSGEGMLHECVEVVPEPVGQWQHSKSHGTNFLDLFYSDPHKWAFAFQQFVMITRIEQEKNSGGGHESLRLLERSVFCDRMVFVRAVHALQQMNDQELEVYDSWFNPLLDMRPQLVPDGFVYLKADPCACERRVEKRRRPEEKRVAFDYLEKLHNFHNSWLVEGGFSVHNDRPPGSVLLGHPHHATRNLMYPASSSGSSSLAGTALGVRDPCLPHHAAASQGVSIPPLPSVLHGNVVLLDRNSLQKATEQRYDSVHPQRMHLMPALHVDCSEDVDVHDPDVINHRATVMDAFRIWVNEYQKQNEKSLLALRNATDEAMAEHVYLPGKPAVRHGNGAESEEKSRAKTARQVPAHVNGHANGHVANSNCPESLSPHARNASGEKIVQETAHV